MIACISQLTGLQMAVPPTKTSEGYEVQFGVNHMGHFLLTKFLLPTLLKTVEQSNSDVRIINLTSAGHVLAPAPGINFADTSLPNKSVWARYGQSKLANILFTKTLAKRYDKILSVAVHPGGVDTNLVNTWLGNYMWLKFLGSLFLKTAQEGAKNQLWAATAERASIESGVYYTPVGVKGEGSGYTKDEKMANELWEWSMKQCTEHGY
jgi:NAD(P)-dependent dehydrogenase (short-subunit alcohol dehydrogenase family)